MLFFFFLFLGLLKLQIPLFSPLCYFINRAQAAAAGKPLARTIVQRYKADQLAAYQTVLETYRIACGDEHTVVKIALAKIAEVKKRVT